MVRLPEKDEMTKLLELDESHFCDFKSKRILPASLQESFIAFANADGGDLYIGVEDKKIVGERIIGFVNQEEANQIIDVLIESTMPTVEGVEWEYIDFGVKGLVLHFDIPKSPKVHYLSDSKTCYVRVNAQKKKITGERITQLAYAKGAISYEKKSVDDEDIENIYSSPVLENYLKRISSNQRPYEFIKKNKLITSGHPTVSCVLLFDEDPQATLSTKCGIKLYRLKTTSSEYERSQLEEPITISGDIETMTNNVLKEIDNIISGSTFIVGQNRVKLKYPTDAIKEIVVNAIIHRDYSLNDDIHIRIYDDRIEIQSPGKLPGYVTLDNIYEERYARNPILVRLLNKLPNPLNKDIGEGLDTAKSALKKAGLVEPEFREQRNSLIVVIKHKKIASIEDSIDEYFNKNPNGEITNKLIRSLTGEHDAQRVKSVLQKLLRQGKIVKLPSERIFDAKYKKKT